MFMSMYVPVSLPLSVSMKTDQYVYTDRNRIRIGKRSSNRKRNMVHVLYMYM
jgi:hypothetical protein